MVLVETSDAVSVDTRSSIGLDGAFVGEVFFRSAAKALNKTIKIYTDKPDFSVVYGGLDADAPTIRIGYVNDNHYVGIIRADLEDNGDGDDDVTHASVEDISTDGHEVDGVNNATGESDTNRMDSGEEQFEAVDPDPEQQMAEYEADRNNIANTLLTFRDGSGDVLSEDQCEMLGEKAMGVKLGFTKDMKSNTYFAPSIHEHITVQIDEAASKSQKVEYTLIIIIRF
jgi:hypothetical protein